MNFNNLNKIFEDKFTISKKLLREEASLKSKKEKSKKKLAESIDRSLSERDWKLTIPGSFRDDMLEAGEEEDFDKVRNILIDMCNYVLEHIDESDFDLDDQEYIIEEFEDFIEELEYVDFEDEYEANYYLNDLYDLLDNTDIFLGLRESLEEARKNKEKYKAIAKTQIYYDNLDNFAGLLEKDIEDVKKELLSLGLKIKGNKIYIPKGTELTLIHDASPDRLIDDDIVEINGYELGDWDSSKNYKLLDFIDESLNEEKISAGDMEQRDIDIIQPLIDDFDALEEANKDVLSITWNFGRRNSDNKMTAGVDIYFLAKGNEDNLQPYVEQVEDIILSNGYRFDDSLGYDADHWKDHMFGDGYHTQIIEDVIEESLTEADEKRKYIVYFKVGPFQYDSTDSDVVLAKSEEDAIRLAKKHVEKDGIWNRDGKGRYRFSPNKNANSYRAELFNESLTESYNEEKPSEEQFKAYCIIQKSGITNMFNVDKVIEASDYVLDIPLTKENILYIYEHYSELLDEYHGFNPDMFESEIYDVRDAYGMSTDDYDESLNESEQTESGYYPDEWDIDFEDELENLGIEPQRGVYVGHQYRVPNRRFAPKMVKLAKEFGYDDSWVEGNTLYLKWSRPEKEYHNHPFDEQLIEDTIKQDGKWVNKGKEGTHGKFKTKKEADSQRKAMFANGYKG